MKKIMFLATVFVAGVATVSVAQHANEKRGEASSSIVYQDTTTPQDTTKPVADSIPAKKDSASVKY